MKKYSWLNAENKECYRNLPKIHWCTHLQTLHLVQWLSPMLEPVGLKVQFSLANTENSLPFCVHCRQLNVLQGLQKTLHYSKHWRKACTHGRCHEQLIWIPEEVQVLIGVNPSCKRFLHKLQRHEHMDKIEEKKLRDQPLFLLMCRNGQLYEFVHLVSILKCVIPAYLYTAIHRRVVGLLYTATHRRVVVLLTLDCSIRQSQSRQHGSG